MISNPIIFYITAFLMIIFGVLTFCLRNVVYSLLSSIVVFFLAALIFYILGSEYNAIIQAAIYGLAVPVIIGVSIMFTNIKPAKSKSHFVLPYLVLLCGGIFVLASVYLIMMSLTILPDTFHIQDALQVNSFESIRIFSHGLFVKYVWAFELVSLLLTIVIAGITLFRKRGA